MFSFLMHRVELKDLSYIPLKLLFHLVPNAPCGVERKNRLRTANATLYVPNAPCGVESQAKIQKLRLTAKGFLMHRVELKAQSSGREASSKTGS